MKKKLLIIIGLILICGLIASFIGFPKSSNQLQTKETSRTFSYTKSFPWDLTLWGNAKLKCTNNGTETSEILVSLLGKKDSESLATSFDISAGKTITKNLSKLASLRKKQKSQSGVILVESENRDIDCQIIKLPFKGSSSIDSSDILMGESYILSTPNVLNNTDKDITGRIVIYNLSDSSLNIEIASYNQAGISDYYKQLKTINAGKKRILKLKNAIKKNLTFHIIPKEEYSRYFAYLELTDQNGKRYSIKSTYEIKESLINNAKGTLVVSNISSSPTSFAYAISSKGNKAYQGNEWLMPYSQRIIELNKYTKNLSSPKMRIKAGNLFKDKKCTYNELLNDKVCSYTTREGLISLSFYSKNTKSPKIIKNARYDELTDIPSYDIDDYLTKEIPVKCYKNKDTDQDGLCDFEEKVYGSNPNNKDSDNDGLEDGIEIFHNFSSPNKVDTDNDNYDDYTEYEARTLSVFPLIYPNSPSLYTIEGMKLLVSYSESLKNNDKNEVKSNQSDEFKTSRAALPTGPFPNSQNSYDGTGADGGTNEWFKNINIDPFLTNKINENIYLNEQTIKLIKQEINEIKQNIEELNNSDKTEENLKELERNQDKLKELNDKKLLLEDSNKKLSENLYRGIDYCNGENICIVNSSNRNNDNLEKIKRIIKNCLNHIRHVIVNEKEKNECNYCKTSFEIKEFYSQCSAGSLPIIIEEQGRAFNNLNKREIVMGVEGRDTQEFILCHELSHSFGLNDIYNQLHHLEVPCTIMNQSLCMPSEYDSLNLQIFSAAWQAANKDVNKININEIINNIKKCNTESNKPGHQVVFKNDYVDFAGKCIKDPEFSFCDEIFLENLDCSKIPDIPCKKCDENNPYLKVNPQNQEEYICCEEENTVYCKGKCCRACINDDCCNNPVEFEGIQICCDKNDSNEYEDDRCLKCKENEILCNNQCCAEGQICDRHLIGKEHCENNPCIDKDGKKIGEAYYYETVDNINGETIQPTDPRYKTLSKLACCGTKNVSKSFFKSFYNKETNKLDYYLHQVCCNKEEIVLLGSEYVCCNKVKEEKFGKKILRRVCCDQDKGFDSEACRDECTGSIYTTKDETGSPIIKCCEKGGKVLEVVNATLPPPTEYDKYHVCCKPNEYSNHKCDSCQKFGGILFHISNYPYDSYLGCCSDYENAFHKDSSHESQDGYPYGICCKPDEVFDSETNECVSCEESKGTLYRSIENDQQIRCCNQDDIFYPIYEHNQPPLGVCCKQGETLDEKSKKCISSSSSPTESPDDSQPSSPSETGSPDDGTSDDYFNFFEDNLDSDEEISDSPSTADRMGY